MVLETNPKHSCFDLEDARRQLWQSLWASAKEDWKHRDVSDALRGLLNQIYGVESYWAYPGKEVLNQLYHYLDQSQSRRFEQLVDNVCVQLETQGYRSQGILPFSTNLSRLDGPKLKERQNLQSAEANPWPKKTYFEVLVIHPDPYHYEMMYRQQLAIHKTDRDEFLYDIVFVNNAEDAKVAILANASIQSVVFVTGFAEKSPYPSTLHQSYKGLEDQLYHASLLSSDLLWDTENDTRNENPAPDKVTGAKVEPSEDIAITPEPTDEEIALRQLCAEQERKLLLLARQLDVLRPELDQFYVCETPIHELHQQVREQFERIIYHIDPFQILHQAILNGIRDRYSTPFFHALQAYSRKPHGVFHALPLSQGRSLQNSHWIQDMLEFYGDNTFLAETSSTQGGLDSLLDPKGAIKQTHHKIAKTFGSEESYLVTNGTSTSNKIVMQTTLRPGDIVIISADCHKSIPYSVMLTGALPIFLETYPLRQHDLYGAVTLERIKEVMLDLKKQGLLERLRHITLTNSTFDGLIYNTERFMLDILAIKGDIIFHWDEAWYAFAHFNPIYSGRTAMTVTRKLQQQFASPAYREFYQGWKKSFDEQHQGSDDDLIQRDLYPDPDTVTLRVYATQSTHKTLTSFRQGSMIHIHDQAFDRDLFLEAYRLHTSTSPNYQILASLDVGRRQVSLEGYERVKTTIALAQKLRRAITESSCLSPFFRVLNDEELVPKKWRSSAIVEQGLYSYGDVRREWGNASFVVDPTRVTVDVSRTGMDGSSFRQLLMNRYDIQVNKTSRHTVLFIVNIGSTDATIAYLMDVLTNIAEQLQQAHQHKAIERVPEVEVDLPQRRYFSAAFKPFECSSCDIGDMRLAFYTAAREENVEFVPLSDETIKEVLNDRKLVSAAFVTPYPPGFPVLTPGQMITYDILLYLQKIRIKEIHGYHAEQGLKVFKSAALSSLLDSKPEPNAHSKNLQNTTSQTKGSQKTKLNVPRPNDHE